MGIGVSIFFVAVGAILTFAVEADVAGFNLDVIGWILMGVGVLGLLVSSLFFASWAPYRRTVVEDRDTTHHHDRRAA